MTTLDSFIKLLPNDIHLISGNQKTPSSLHLSFSEEDFLKILNNFSEDQIVFRFLEKTPKDELLVHIAFLIEGLILQVTIDVKNRTHEFKTKLCSFFSSAEVFSDEF